MSSVAQIAGRCTITGGLTDAKGPTMSKLYNEYRVLVAKRVGNFATLPMRPAHKTAADAVGLTAIRGLTVTNTGP